MYLIISLQWGQIDDTKEFLEKLDQFKQYSNIVAKVSRRTTVLNELNHSDW